MFHSTLRSSLRCCEGRRLRETGEIAEEHQLRFVESGLQSLQEQPPIQSRQNPDGEEEVRLAPDPSSVGSEAAAWYDTVSVRMMRQGLAPGVENGDHAGLCAEVLWIGGDDADRLGGRLEQNVIDDCLVLQGDGGNCCRHREDDVEIRHRQQIGLTIGKPLGACQALALRAVPVAAAVVGDADHAAVVAPLDMATERCRPARRDGGHDPALVGQEPTALGSTKRLTVAAENVRHLQRGSHRSPLFGRNDLQSELIERARRPGDQSGRDLGIARCRLQVAVTE